MSITFTSSEGKINGNTHFLNCVRDEVSVVMYGYSISNTQLPGILFPVHNYRVFFVPRNIPLQVNYMAQSSIAKEYSVVVYRK